MRLNWIRARLVPAWDVAFAAFWLIVGWLFFIGRYRGEYPFVSLDSDTAQVAAFTAARINADGFAGDYILSNPHNYTFYSTLQIPAAIAVSRWVGDLGLAFILPLCFLVAVQGIGFYLLGRHIFANRPFASLFSLAMLAVLPIPALADYWGIKGYTTPRDWFQAFIPLILLLVLTRAQHERWRFGIMALIGIMTYVHPVSTPHWALGVWLSLWCFLPSDWPVSRRLGRMVLYALTFVLAASFFAVNFVASRLSAQNAPPEAVFDVLRYRLTPGYTNLSVAFGSFFDTAWRSGTLVFGLLGLGLLFVHRDRSDIKRRVVAVWVGAVVLGACVIPVVDHSVARALNRLFLQFDFVRGVRYLFPLAWLAGFWGLSLLSERSGKMRAVAALAAALFMFVLLQRCPISEIFVRGTEMAFKGQLVPGRTKLSERRRALIAAAEAPGDARFLASTTEDALALRFFSRRSVVYSYKDGGAFVYSNQAAMLDWQERNDLIVPIVGRAKLSGNVIPPKRLAAFARLAKLWGANHLFLAQQVTTAQLPAGGRLIFGGKRYSVIAL